MSELEDLRWVQRFRSFQKAFHELAEAVSLAHARSLSKLEAQGLIQAFEFTHELAWKVMKDYIEHRGGQKLLGSKDSTKAAFKANLFASGEIWMNMIEDRNLSVHTYSQIVASEIARHVIDFYFDEFRFFESKLAVEINNGE